MIEPLRRAWRWLVTPLPMLPPVPRDENMRGLGWAGDRNELRPWLVSWITKERPGDR